MQLWIILFIGLATIFCVAGVVVVTADSVSERAAKKRAAEAQNVGKGDVKMIVTKSSHVEVAVYVEKCGKIASVNVNGDEVTTNSDGSYTAVIESGGKRQTKEK